MQKDLLRILYEAFIVGILLIILYYPLKILLKKIGGGIDNDNIILFISGGLFHIICEYSGINLMYVEDYNKILKQ